jgi:hypothetical protein
MSPPKLKSLFRSTAKQFLMVSIPDPDVEPLKPYETYFGVWLTHSFLKHDRTWLKKYYPAAHVSVKLQVAGETTTLTKLARPAEGTVGPGVWANFPITGLLPYNGGIVEIEAGLTALKTDSFLGAAVGVVDDFSGLIVPPVSEALAVTNMVTKGVQTLLDAGNGEAFLSLHQAYVASGEGAGENQLRPGYLAVVGATQKQLTRDSLTVRDSVLHMRDGALTAPLEGYDYLLFRIEGRRERDDWRFPRIESFIDKARQARDAGEAKSFERNRDAALAEVLISPDLTLPDRTRVALAIRDELRDLAMHGAGAVGPPMDGLKEIIARRAVPVDDPRALAELTLSDLLDNRAAGF